MATYDALQRKQGLNGGDQAGANPSGLGKQIVPPNTVINGNNGKEVISPSPQVANTVLSKMQGKQVVQPEIGTTLSKMEGKTVLPYVPPTNPVTIGNTQGKIHVDPPTVLSKMEGKTLIPRLAEPPTLKEMGITPFSATTSQVIAAQDPSKVADYNRRKEDLAKSLTPERPFVLGSGRGIVADTADAFKPDNLRKALPAFGAETVRSGLESLGRNIGSALQDPESLRQPLPSGQEALSNIGRSIGSSLQDPESLRQPLPAFGAEAVRGGLENLGKSIGSGLQGLKPLDQSNLSGQAILDRLNGSSSGSSFNQPNRGVASRAVDAISAGSHINSPADSSQLRLALPTSPMPTESPATPNTPTVTPKTDLEKLGIDRNGNSFSASSSGLVPYDKANLSNPIRSYDHNNPIVFGTGSDAAVFGGPSQAPQSAQPTQSSNYQNNPVFTEFKGHDYTTDASFADIASTQNMFERAVEKGQPRLAAALASRLNSLEERGMKGLSLSQESRDNAARLNAQAYNSILDSNSKRETSRDALQAQLSSSAATLGQKQEANSLAAQRLALDTNKAQQESELAKTRLGLDATNSEANRYQKAIENITSPNRLIPLPAEQKIASLYAAKNGNLNKKDLNLVFPQGTSSEDMLASLKGANLSAEEAYKLMR